MQLRKGNRYLHEICHDSIAIYDLSIQWHQLVPFWPPHIAQSNWIHGQTHQPVVWWIIASCLPVNGIWSHLKATRALVDVWQAWETSHSKSSLGNFQHQNLPELLLNVYTVGYHLMVKVCLTVMCVEAGLSQIWSHMVAISTTPWPVQFTAYILPKYINYTEKCSFNWYKIWIMTAFGKPVPNVTRTKI